MEKKCTRIVHWSAQMDKRPFIDRPLYSGQGSIDGPLIFNLFINELNDFK